MPIKINGQTTGSVTLNAPATGSDVSLTLPTLGFGKVLQVVQNTTSTLAESSSTSYSDTNLSATITPFSTSSRVLILVHHNGAFVSVEGASNGLQLRILRDSTPIYVFAEDWMWTGTALEKNGSVSGFYLDSPNTISSTTYKTQLANRVAANRVRVQNSSRTSTMVLIEVGP